MNIAVKVGLLTGAAAIAVPLGGQLFLPERSSDGMSARSYMRQTAMFGVGMGLAAIPVSIAALSEGARSVGILGGVGAAIGGALALSIAGGGFRAGTEHIFDF